MPAFVGGWVPLLGRGPRLRKSGELCRQNRGKAWRCMVETPRRARVPGRAGETRGGIVKTVVPDVELEDDVHRERLEAMFLRAKAAERERDLVRAIALYEGLLREGSGFGRAWIRYSMILQRQRKFGEARELLKRGLKANPTNAILWQNWADLEKGLGNYVTARKLFQKGLEANSTLPSLYHSWGMMEYKLGRTDDARKLYKRGLKNCPRSRWLYHALATLEDIEGRSEVARSLLTRALEFAPDDAHLHHAFGLLEYKQGNASTAREWFASALRVDPEHTLTWLSWGQLEECEGNSDMARKYYSKGTEIRGGGSVQLWQAWASMEQKMGNVERALNLYEMATRAHPKDARLYCSWGKLLSARGERSAARQLFRTGLVVDETYAPLWQSLALMEESLLDIEEARKVYAEGARKGRGKGVAALLHSWAVLEWKESNEEEARKLFKKAVEADPECAWIWLWFGRFEFECRNLELARHYLCLSINLDPRDASPWRAWGELEREDGNEEQARFMVKRAAELEGVRALYQPKSENPLRRQYPRF